MKYALIEHARMCAKGRMKREDLSFNYFVFCRRTKYIIKEIE